MGKGEEEKGKKRKGRTQGGEGDPHPTRAPRYVSRGNLTFLLWRWMSPMELATVLGPSNMRVLRGHSVLTR